MPLLNELGGSRTQVSRPEHPESGAPQGRPAHGHHKTQAVKKRLAEVAPCAGLQIGLLNPTADFAAMGRDYSPILSGASERNFLGCFTGMKAKRRTKCLILKAKQLTRRVHIQHLYITEILVSPLRRVPF